MHIDKTKRQKLDNKALKVVLVGYVNPQKTYRVWEPGTKRVYVSRDVVIVEKPLPIKKTIPLEFETEESDLIDDDTNQEEEIRTVQQSKQSVGVRENMQTRQMTNDFVGNRTRSKSKSNIMAIGEAFIVDGIPETLEEVQKSSDAKEWEEAMADEIESLKRNSTWKLVKPPPNHKAINNKWIFRVKTKTDGTIERYKARLVVKGCSQKYRTDHDEIYAPVARFESIRILLSTAVAKNYKIQQFDIKTAFLYGDLDNLIYMKQSEGFDDGSGRVCQLLKSLYGLKQAPRQWHYKFNEALKKLGFTPSNYDPCIYSNSDGTLLLALYVDDGLIAGKNRL